MEWCLTGATPQDVGMKVHSAGGGEEGLGQRAGVGFQFAVEIKQLQGHESPDLARIHEGW